MSMIARVVIVIDDSDCCDSEGPDYDGIFDGTGTVSKVTFGKLLRGEVERIWAFLSAYIHS